MTKQVHVYGADHGKLHKLKGILYEKNVAEVVKRLLIQAGYNTSFWVKHAALETERNEKAIS